MSKDKQRRQAYSRRRAGQASASPLLVGGLHPVAAALRSSLRVERVCLEQTAGRRAHALAERARERGITVIAMARGECERLTGVRSQGIAAEVVYSYAELPAILGSDCDLLIFCDGIMDPHNLGSIARTAAAAGVGALVIPRRRAALVTAAVARASAGAVLCQRVCQVTNLVRAIEQAGAAGFWLVGLDSHGDQLLSPEPGRQRVGLVVGGEGKGLRRLVAERCDVLARLPMVPGGVESLNASVAVGIAIYRLREKMLFAGKSVDTRHGGC